MKHIRFILPALCITMGLATPVFAAGKNEKKLEIVKKATLKLLI